MYTLLEAIPLPKLFPVLGNILEWLNTQTGNIGIAVILFTILIKFVLLPLDYWSRSGMKKNQLKMEKMKPQLEKLQKAYAHDKMLYNQKMQSVYKKEGYSPMGACLPTIVTMVMFILVFNALNGYLKYNLIAAYNQMVEGYMSVNQDPVEWAKVASQYQEQFAPSFLWVKNVWLPDSPLKKAVMDVETFSTVSGITTLAGVNIDAGEYNNLIAPFVATSNGVNGFFIFPILSAATSYFMQLVMSKTQQTQMELQGQAQTNKMMLIMMPVMMGIFALQWNTAFAIYLVTSSLFSFVSTVLINKIVDVRFRKEEAEIKAAQARR